MFNGISWGQYSLFLFGLCVLYYLVVGALYFRAEILAFVQTKRPGARPVAAPVAPTAPRSPVKLATAVLPVTPVLQSVVESAPVARVVEPAPVEPTPQTIAEPENSLIGVENLAGFLEKVETGQFNPETDASQIPAALENTVLLTELFARSLSKHRAQLADIEE